MAGEGGLQKAIFLKENLPDPYLLEVGPGTITIATPGVITLANHQLSPNQKVYISTTGALPTGLLPDTEYFVNILTENTFTLSSTMGSGIPINTSGTQSGIHTFSRAGYYVRYRVVSEDRSKKSHDSPVYFVSDPYDEQFVTTTIDGGIA